ncbi:MAG: glycosyltransferase, partial [Chthoniobacterales bacterium]
SELAGGAGMAAQRLHFALCKAGVNSRLYFGQGEAVDSTMVPAFQNRTFFWRNAVALASGWRGRREVKGGFVTSPRWVHKTPIQRFGGLPRVINLHWVARWLDLPSFLGSFPAELPVVWSIHDFIPITGGCHYPGQCDHFTRHCGNCPQLKRPARFDETYRFFGTKERCYSRVNLHLVGNSEWTTSQIRRSGLAKHAKSIRTIHLGLDPEQFRPVDKSLARRALGIPHDRFLIGFACSDLSEERKGARLLLEAVRSLPRPPVLLTFGAGRWPSSSVTEMIQLGVLQSPQLQCLFYSAADVFVTPSRAETFGYTALEAMACETPVIAYAVGGLTDVVEQGVTGLLEPDIGSVSGLTQMLRWMSQHPNERQTMGIAARRRVIENFTDAVMAQRYSELYKELLSAL